MPACKSVPFTYKIPLLPPIALRRSRLFFSPPSSSP